jgi:hypothetical protein
MANNASTQEWSNYTWCYPRGQWIDKGFWGKQVLCIAAVNIIPGKARGSTQILCSTLAIRTGPARSKQPSDAHPVALIVPTTS